jgi:hypothetical protein
VHKLPCLFTLENWFKVQTLTIKVATVKDETHTFELMKEILVLMSLNQHNRVMILEWCDALRSRTSTCGIIQSDALEPNGVKIEFDVDASTLHLVNQSTPTVVEVIASDRLAAFINTVISGIEQTMSDFDRLPKRLRRLVTWQSSFASQVSPPATVLPTNITQAQRVFYSAVWQHFQTDPFAVRRNRESILLFSRKQTTRLCMSSGRVLKTYDGHCIPDDLNRIYQISDHAISQIGANGQVCWSTAFDLQTLPHGLHAVKNTLVIAEPNRISVLHAHSGQAIWRAQCTALTLRVAGDWLYTIHTSDDIVIHRRQLPAQRPIEVLRHQGTVVKHWWLKDHLVICSTLRNDELCTHAFFIELSTGTSHEMRLPPTRPLCASASDRSIALLITSVTEHHLVSFELETKCVRLLSPQLPHPPEQILHHDRSTLILGNSDNHLISICPDTFAINWDREILSELPRSMERVLMHQGLMIVPGGPVHVIDTASGRTLSTIDDPLYADARPLLVDQRRLLLHDEAGYLGQFEVRGHISATRSDSEE